MAHKKESEKHEHHKKEHHKKEHEGHAHHKKEHDHHMKMAKKHMDEMHKMAKNSTPRREPVHQKHAFGNGAKKVGSPHDINKGKHNEVYKADKYR